MNGYQHWCWWCSTRIQTMSTSSFESDHKYGATITCFTKIIILENVDFSKSSCVKYRKMKCHPWSFLMHFKIIVFDDSWWMSGVLNFLMISGIFQMFPCNGGEHFFSRCKTECPSYAKPSLQVTRVRPPSIRSWWFSVQKHLRIWRTILWEPVGASKK